jgi:uncharacterized paraquat-inducible protein A
MNRRLTTIFAAAALAVVASAPAALSTAAQETAQESEQTGRRAPRPVTTSCPAHPEIKARSAGKCPKCRMAERNRRSAQEKRERRAKAQEGTPAQAGEGAPVDEQ